MIRRLVAVVALLTTLAGTTVALAPALAHRAPRHTVNVACGMIVYLGPPHYLCISLNSEGIVYR